VIDREGPLRCSQSPIRTIMIIWRSAAHPYVSIDMHIDITSPASASDREHPADDSAELTLPMDKGGTMPCTSAKTLPITILIPDPPLRC
jgi:hypothetical protein